MFFLNLILLVSISWAEDKCFRIMPNDLEVCENQWQAVYDLNDLSHSSPTQGYNLGYIREILPDGMMLVEKHIVQNVGMLGEAVTMVYLAEVLPENLVVMRAEMNGVGAGNIVIIEGQKHRVEDVFDAGKNHPGYFLINGLGLVSQSDAEKAPAPPIDRD